MSDFAPGMIYLKDSLEREIQSLKNSIEEHEMNLQTIKSFLRKYCSHEWVIDDIDIDPDRSRRIKYCLKCELQAPR